MKAGVITFPGSNADRDLREAFLLGGWDVVALWHKETMLPPDLDIVALPGGFSYGDYLRGGAMAARSPICQAVREFAAQGGYVLGICNGFQILCEMGLLPGILVTNVGIKFISKTIALKVDKAGADFYPSYNEGDVIDLPIAHKMGNYFADEQTLEMLENEGLIAFRYLDNPNGSAHDIAGIVSQNCRILGMMPHPERANSLVLNDNADGAKLFCNFADKKE